MAHDVFISYYSKTSESIVKRIAGELEDRGVRCWYASQNSSSNYSGIIVDAIEASRVFLLVLNKEASESRNVLSEMHTAFEKKNIEILPFHIADDDDEISSKARYYTGIFHKVDARNDFDGALEELIRRIVSIVKQENEPLREESDRISLSYCGHSHRVKAQTIIFGDNHFYKGQVLNGKPNGKGRMTFPNGWIYEGEFEYGIRSGKGREYANDGQCYEGEFLRDMRHGKGKFTYRNQNTYEGDFHHGKLHGKGKYTWRNGDVFEGDYKNDKREGMGKTVLINGHVYEGEYADDQRNGRARFQWPDGAVYRGSFMKGHICGQGSKIWANGDVYVGQWQDDKRHGEGIFITADGEIFQGRFENDRYIGV